MSIILIHYMYVDTKTNKRVDLLQLQDMTENTVSLIESTCSDTLQHFFFLDFSTDFGLKILTPVNILS